MRPGDKVLIRQNPHQPGVQDIIGTIVAFRAEEGFGGCNLVDVQYKHPKNGNEYILPFKLSCLASTDASSLIMLAEYHEAIAAGLRALAEADTPSK